MHSECCAQVNGTRQTCSLHVSGPDNPLFVPLPRLTSDKKMNSGVATLSCKPCHGDNPPLTSPTEVRPLLIFSIIALKNIQSTAVDVAMSDQHPADYINSLNITGRLTPKARGKELVLAICNKSNQRNVSGPILKYRFCV